MHCVNAVCNIEGEKVMRLIKRYDNRKLYDTETSKTVTLKDLATLIRDGEEIKVIDAADKDITNRVLAQIFLQENVETKQLVFSEFLLEWLIKESSKMETFTKKLLFGSLGLASITQEKVEQLVTELIKRGEVKEYEKSTVVKQIVERVEKSSSDFKQMVEGLVNEVTAKDKKEEKSNEEMLVEKEQEIEELKKQINLLSQGENKNSLKKTAKTV